jgi:hypothetical protein
MKGSAYLQARQLFWTGGGTVRRGRSVPDGIIFDARAAWEGDSLVFVPYSRDGNTGDLPGPSTPAAALALQKVRELFRDVATAWVSGYPNDPDALEALAVSLEMLGDPTSIDTLRRAVGLARTADERVRLLGAEFWMHVKFAIPLDNARIRTAKQLADSLLALGAGAASEARLLSSIAALTGRANLAAYYNTQASAEWRAPAPIARTAASLLVFAALGGPVDSLEALDARVSASIEHSIPSSEQRDARLEWLGRAATLAFPIHRTHAIQALAGTGDPLVDAQAALSRGDSARVRAYFAELRTRRRHYPPQMLTLDGLYPEAALLATLGQYGDAVSWLDPTLNALASTAPLAFTDPARAGALVRAMALRAELAAQLDDRAAAARWARAVVLLLPDADSFLVPLVRRMEQLAR